LAHLLQARKGAGDPLLLGQGSDGRLHRRNDPGNGPATPGDGDLLAKFDGGQQLGEPGLAS
jgi:hypothetical protein